ncbi:cupin domain-containing protein [Saccharothrix sp. DSM 118769]
MTEVIHRRAGQGPTLWFGDAVYTFKADSAETDGSLVFAEATVPPGGGPPPHVHPFTDEAFFVLSGELEFLKGTEVFRAGEGDFVWVPRGTRHRFLNVGTHVSRLIFLFSPGAGMEGFFRAIGTEARAGEAPAPLTPEQRRMIPELAPRFGIVLAPPPLGGNGV